MNIKSLLAGAIGAYGLYLLYQGQMGDGFTPLELGKSLTMSGLGVGGLGYFNWDSIKSMVTKRKAKSEKIFVPADYENYDLQCLLHLQKRCLEGDSTEGVELCSKLNTVLFNLGKNKDETTKGNDA